MWVHEPGKLTLDIGPGQLYHHQFVSSKCQQNDWEPKVAVYITLGGLYPNFDDAIACLPIRGLSESGLMYSNVDSNNICFIHWEPDMKGEVK